MKDKSEKDEDERYQAVLGQLDTEKIALEKAKSELISSHLSLETLSAEKEKLNDICQANQAEIISLQVAVLNTFTLLHNT